MFTINKMSEIEQFIDLLNSICPGLNNTEIVFCNILKSMCTDNPNLNNVPINSNIRNEHKIERYINLNNLVIYSFELKDTISKLVKSYPDLNLLKEYIIHDIKSLASSIGDKTFANRFTHFIDALNTYILLKDFTDDERNEVLEHRKIVDFLYRYNKDIKQNLNVKNTFNKLNNLNIIINTYTTNPKPYIEFIGDIWKINPDNKLFTNYIYSLSKKFNTPINILYILFNKANIIPEDELNIIFSNVGQKIIKLLPRTTTERHRELYTNIIDNECLPEQIVSIKCNSGEQKICPDTTEYDENTICSAFKNGGTRKNINKKKTKKTKRRNRKNVRF